MEDRDQMNFNRGNNHQGKQPPLAGVVALAVVTAGVLGSVIFSFGERESSVIPVSQLIESAQEEGSALTLGQQEEEPTAVSEAAVAAAGRIKGPLDVSDVVEATMPSIVAITNESVQVVESYFYGTREIPSESAGSGIIIGRSDEELLIATNYHVVENADSITVCFSVLTEESDEAIVEAKMKGSDSTKDLAVVAVSMEEIPESVLEAVKVASLGDSDQLKVGERAIAIGNALGYGQSVTAGIVSAVNRELTIDRMTQNFVQTDAAINFGNSGGALLNADGEVIGINSAKAANSGVEGMGYAIPINAAKPILEELMNRTTRDKVDASERGSLGATFRNVSDEARQLYDIPAGAFVYQLEEDSVLKKAGVVRGDIITEMDGNSISSAEVLESLLSYYKVGETVELVYQTSENGAYQEKTVSVILQEEPVAEENPWNGGSPSNPYDFFGNDLWSGNWW